MALLKSPAKVPGDAESLTLLINALYRLKSDGSMSEVGDVWAEPEVHDEKSYIEDACLFHEGIASLQKLKGARRCLGALVESLDTKLGNFMDKISPASRRFGIMKVPDEILGRIFTLACLKADDDTPEKISQVCRHFRLVSESLPSLWGSVDNKLAVSTLERRLSLSRSVPLTVALHAGSWVADDGHEWKPFLDVIMPLKTRWRDLSVYFNGPFEEVETFLSYPGAELSSLETLTFAYPEWFRENNEDYEFLFHSSWSFPNVTTLLAKHSIPLCDYFPSLTHCTLSNPYHLKAFHVGYLVDFLNSVPTLECLSITDIGETKITEIIYTDGDALAIAELPNLRVFNISSFQPRQSFVRRSTEYIIPIIKSLNIPNVEDMTVTVHCCKNDDSVDDIVGVFSQVMPKMSDRHYNALKHFSLRCTYSYMSEISIEEFALRFPSLETLELSTPVHDFDERTRRLYAEGQSNPRSALRSLRFRDCPKLSPGTLLSLIRTQAGRNINNIELIGNTGRERNLHDNFGELETILGHHGVKVIVSDD